MKQTLSLITLAVEDVARSLAFYRDGLGWTPKLAMDDIAFFQMNGFVFSIFKKDGLAKDFGGKIIMGGKSISLSHNVPRKEEVDAAINKIRKLKGAAIVCEPVDRVWGGYSGYFEDPDGHVWEVGWNPHWTFSPDGFVTI